MNDERTGGAGRGGGEDARGGGGRSGGAPEGGEHGAGRATPPQPAPPPGGPEPLPGAPDRVRDTSPPRPPSDGASEKAVPEPGASGAGARTPAGPPAPPPRTARPRPAERRRLRSALAAGPPGPARPEFWRSPLRGPWLTAVLGAVLLAGMTVVAVTGLLSYAAYNPGLHPVNDKTPDKGWLGFYLFAWPTGPYWLYRVTQGVHVTLGIVLVPVLLAKLWSVIPKLFAWPPLRSVRHAVDRVSVLLLVGSALFETATGILNIQLEYVFPGSFYPLHFYGAWVFVAAFTVHVASRLGRVRQALRGRSWRTELRTPTVRTEPEPPDAYGLVAPRPAAPTMSRRGALGMVGLGSAALLATTAGQSIGGPLRATALLAPRGRDPGGGPNGFQINKTAAQRGIRARDVGAGWRLRVRGGRDEVALTRDELLALPQHTAALPIACVEGWSTSDQEWSGVRLADLAELAGPASPGGGPGANGRPDLYVESAQRRGSFRAAALRYNQVRDPRSLLALRVNGADLSLDHGYPARIIVPNNPGVLNTKWVTALSFGKLG